MWQIPKPIEYALMVLGKMQAGDPGELFPMRSVCEELGIPFDLTSKTMQRLKHAGIVRSVQGKYGGYEISRDLKSVTMGELSRVIVGPSSVTRCLEEGVQCPLQGSCTIRRAMGRLNKHLHRMLGEVSVAELLDS